MLTRLLAMLLVFTTLAGNAAWATDIHLNTGSNQDTADIVACNDNLGSPDGESACPDHCGHGVAHLLGLRTSSDSMLAMPLCPGDFFYLDRLATRFLPPPSEPPRA